MLFWSRGSPPRTRDCEDDPADPPHSAWGPLPSCEPHLAVLGSQSLPGCRKRGSWSRRKLGKLAVTPGLGSLGVVARDFLLVLRSYALGLRSSGPRWGWDSCFPSVMGTFLSQARSWDF